MRKLLLNAQALADAATRPGRPFPDGSVCCCNPWHPRPKNRTLDIELDPIIKARRAVHLRRPLPLPPPKSSTVVASLVWNYELEFFRIYVLSLRAHYDGDIVLLMYAKPPDDVLQFILEQRVTPMPIVEPPDFLVARFEDYARVCQAGVYSLCLISDFRDVFFQADPFAHVPSPPPGLLLPLEELRIGQCIHNHRWLTVGYGPAVARQFNDRRVSRSASVDGAQCTT